MEERLQSGHIPAEQLERYLCQTILNVSHFLARNHNSPTVLHQSTCTRLSLHAITRAL
jgi:hypothetical protein